MENSLDSLRTLTFYSIKFDLTELPFLFSLISSITEKWVHDERQEEKDKHRIWSTVSPHIVLTIGSAALSETICK